MEFSPEGQLTLDSTSNSLRAILSDLLEEKLESHLRPLKQDLSLLKSNVETQNVKNIRDIVALQGDIVRLEAENKSLRAKVTKLESFQRKNNLRLVGITEDKGKLLEIILLGLFNGLLIQACHFNGHTFERIHRLGVFKQGRTRVVIARF